MIVSIALLFAAITVIGLAYMYGWDWIDTQFSAIQSNGDATLVAMILFFAIVLTAFFAVKMWRSDEKATTGLVITFFALSLSAWAFVNSVKISEFLSNNFFGFPLFMLGIAGLLLPLFGKHIGLLLSLIGFGSLYAIRYFELAQEASVDGAAIELPSISGPLKEFVGALAGSGPIMFFVFTGIVCILLLILASLKGKKVEA